MADSTDPQLTVPTPSPATTDLSSSASTPLIPSSSCPDLTQHADLADDSNIEVPEAQQETLLTRAAADEAQWVPDNAEATASMDPGPDPADQPMVRPQYTRRIVDPNDIPRVRGMQPRKVTWLIDGWIVEGGIHMLSGPPGSMKS